MQTAIVNFDVASSNHAQRNADWQKTLTCTLNGSAVNLTGITFVMTVRPFPGGAEIAKIQTTDVTWQGIKVPTPTNGIITLQIAQATLATCPAPPNVGDTYSCIYDILAVDGAGHSSCWFSGTLDIAYGVS